MVDFIDKESAFNLAQEAMNSLAPNAANEFEIQSSKTKETKNGWIFFYNSKRFIHDKDPMYQLAGNGPLFVSVDGAVRMLSSATDWQTQIDGEATDTRSVGQDAGQPVRQERWQNLKR